MYDDWINNPAKVLDRTAEQQALARQNQLTKPPGALGRLEELAVRLAAMQGKVNPVIEQVAIVVFAADHGIASRGVSAFPQAVTTEMVRNFANGGAAISVLARALGAELEVVNLGTVLDPGPLAKVIDRRIAPGTRDFSREPAMTQSQFHEALNIGRQSAERAKRQGGRLYIGGEMGIGNTTAATAIACALLDKSPEQLAGPGTGLDEAGVRRKAEIIRQSLLLHRHLDKDVSQILQHFGGFEIVALSGAFAACAQMGIPVLIDGFIASVAALATTYLCENASDWFIFSHASAEPGHAIILESLNTKPLLNLGMRLGEGSGAATAVPLLQLGCRLHNEMATFEQAHVSNKYA